MKRTSNMHAPEHDHRYEEASIKAMRKDEADNPTPESDNQRNETDAAIRQNNMWQGGNRQKQAAPAQAITCKSAMI